MRRIGPGEVAAIVLWLALQFGGVVLPSLPNITLPWPAWVQTKATSATYVYEKDATAIPPAVGAALNRLNREKQILATLFEQDTTDGTGETPKQYVVPLAAAKQAGLPALVVTAGDKVLRVVKNPQTDTQVMEAIP